MVRWRHRDVTDDDVLLASFPRSGNTYVKNMLADLMAGGEVDFWTTEAMIPSVGQGEASVRLPDGGRLLKTHERYRRCYARAVYMVRDVRDVAASYVSWNRARGRAAMPADEFVDHLIRGWVDGYGSWQDHVASYLDARDGGRDILVVRFEDLHNDPVDVLGEIAAFIGLDADEEMLRATVERNDAGNVAKRLARMTDQHGLLGRRFAASGKALETFDGATVSRLQQASPALSRLGYDPA